MEHFEVIIVGAGPAGLSAALILGRCCRKTLVCDAGTPRSWASKGMHGYLSRDGIHPREFNELSRREIAKYRNVQSWNGEVVRIKRGRLRFEVTLADGRKAQSRKVLLATGVMDELPAIPRIKEFFGTSVFQCPYCDGWEMRNRPIAVYAKGVRALSMTRAMTAWTGDIVLCSDGPVRFSKEDRKTLRSNAIVLIEKRVAALEGSKGQMTAVVFCDGSRIERQALFFDLPSHPQSRLTQMLGCSFTRDGQVKCGKYEATSAPGVYIAGNIVGDVQLSIVAAAEGAKAAFGINKSLTREDFERRRSTRVKYIEHPQ